MNLKKENISVVRSYETPNIQEGNYLLGVKDTDYISESTLKVLREAGFIKHTLDKMADNGRAIDLDLQNPLTKRVMTGSSSGTAINVFSGLNDIGLGTDGGGSVLAPAMSLNLYGFISPLLYYNETYTKKSTDSIIFTPSIGFLSKDLSILKKAVYSLINKSNSEVMNIAVPNSDYKNVEGREVLTILCNSLKFNDDCKFTKIDFLDTSLEREELIPFVEETLNKYDAILTFEGPIDVFGIGDSYFGNESKENKESQRKSGKGLLRVVNMAKKSAITVPSKDLASGFLIITNSDEESIDMLFRISEMIKA